MVFNRHLPYERIVTDVSVEVFQMIIVLMVMDKDVEEVEDSKTEKMLKMSTTVFSAQHQAVCRPPQEGPKHNN